MQGRGRGAGCLVWGLPGGGGACTRCRQRSRSSLDKEEQRSRRGAWRGGLESRHHQHEGKIRPKGAQRAASGLKFRGRGSPLLCGCCSGWRREELGRRQQGGDGRLMLHYGRAKVGTDPMFGGGRGGPGEYSELEAQHLMTAVGRVGQRHWPEVWSGGLCEGATTSEKMYLGLSSASHPSPHSCSSQSDLSFPSLHPIP